jgi:hypothetical protein
MEDTRNTLNNYRLLRVFSYWVSIVSGLVIIGVAVYAVWCVRQYIPIVGYIWLGTVAILPTIGMCFLIVGLARYICKTEVIEIGPAGNLVKCFNRITPYHPLGVKEYRVSPERKHVDKEQFHVPTMLSLLQERVLGGLELLLGYTTNGEPKWGTWNDLRTFVIAGKSRSGKTVTLVFFILQALLAGAQVWVCDPHYNKPSGLLRVLKPIEQHIRVAKRPDEIVQMTQDFETEMHLRESNNSTMGSTDTGWVPIVLVYDEWTYLLRNLDKDTRDIPVQAVLDCAEAYADFQGYAIVAGHEWTARESGGKYGAAVRRGFHSVCVHRLDEDYSKFLLNSAKGRKAAKLAPNLATGHMLFQDSEAEEISELVIPFYGKDKEAIYEVAEMLRELPGVPEHKLLEMPTGRYSTPKEPAAPLNSTDTAVNDKQDHKHPVNGLVERVDATLTVFQENVNTDKLETVSETETPAEINASIANIETFVQRARKRGMSHRDISYIVGLYGPKYAHYQELCDKLGIPLQ